MSKPLSDILARRYCFKAVATMHKRQQIYGKFTAYDYRVSVMEEVKKACETHCLSDPQAFCSEIELTLLESCPVELTSSIHFEFVRPEEDDQRLQPQPAAVECGSDSDDFLDEFTRPDDQDASF